MQLLSLLPVLLVSTFSSALPQLWPPTIERVRQDSCDLEGVYRIMNSSLPDFMDLFTSQSRPDCYHWCTNACSYSPDSWIGVDPVTKISFKPACARHDFSWHNLKKFGAFDQGNKLNADTHLRDGMKELCGDHKTCANDVADLYYHAVRIANEPASEYNTWGPKEVAKELKCTIFPGCCSNHSDTARCGETMTGQHNGDQSCIARS
jgi:hypothetical protein